MNNENHYPQRLETPDCVQYALTLYNVKPLFNNFCFFFNVLEQQLRALLHRLHT